MSSQIQKQSKPTILIVDDEVAIRLSLRGILEEDEGYKVLECGSAEEALETIAKELPDLVLLDIWLPGLDGISALAEIREEYPHLPVIMISGHGNIETAVSAIRLGAHDFIEKPLSLGKIILSVHRTLEFAALTKENQVFKSSSPKNVTELTGDSPAILEVKKQIEQVAPTDTWVLITGQNGTGKEIAARSIHNKSRRAERPLIALNCAAIPEELIESELFGYEKGAFTGADSPRVGKFELAHQGTLFLDEIADMSLKTQAKILRILQEKEFERLGGSRTIRVNVRVIAATNKNLEEEIAAGRFRDDLYYRLKVFPLELPPLKKRGNDILLLAEIFQANLVREHGLKPIKFSDSAISAILAYEWPGNVRELRNFMERMLIIHGGKEVFARHLPDEMREAPCAKASHTGEQREQRENDLASSSFNPMQYHDLRRARQEFEAYFLSKKLKEFQNNITRMAEAVGMERSHLSRKLKSYGIQTEE